MSPEEKAALNAIKEAFVAIGEVQRPNPFAHIGPGPGFGSVPNERLVPKPVTDALLARLDVAVQDEVAVGMILNAFGSIVPAFESLTSRFLA